MDIKDHIEVKPLGSVGSGPERFMLELIFRRIAVGENNIEDQKNELLRDLEQELKQND